MLNTKYSKPKPLLEIIYNVSCVVQYWELWKDEFFWIWTMGTKCQHNNFILILIRLEAHLAIAMPFDLFAIHSFVRHLLKLYWNNQQP